MDFASMKNVAFEQIYYLGGKTTNDQERFWQFQASQEIDIQNKSSSKEGSIGSGFVLNQLVHERIVGQLKKGLEAAATESLFFW